MSTNIPGPLLGDRAFDVDWLRETLADAGIEVGTVPKSNPPFRGRVRPRYLQVAADYLWHSGAGSSWSVPQLSSHRSTSSAVA